MNVPECPKWLSWTGLSEKGAHDLHIFAINPLSLEGVGHPFFKMTPFSNATNKLGLFCHRYIRWRHYYVLFSVLVISSSQGAPNWQSFIVYFCQFFTKFSHQPLVFVTCLRHDDVITLPPLSCPPIVPTSIDQALLKLCELEAYYQISLALKRLLQQENNSPNNEAIVLPKLRKRSEGQSPCT